MSFQSSMNVLRCYLAWFLFLVVRYSLAAIQHVAWRWNGTYQELKKCQHPDNYSSSAHKMKIIYNVRLDPFTQINMRDYILTHHSFLAPEYVLRDDVHLMQVAEKDAIFVQIAKGAKGPECYPFAVYGYLTAAEHIIVMPLESLHRLANGMDAIDSKLVMIHNQGRCGGTLFTEIFKATGRCVTFGEPHTLTLACSLYLQRMWTRSMMVATLKSIMKLHCKPHIETKRKPLAYVIKPTPATIYVADLIREAFPDAIQFFIYRNPINVAVSIRKAFETLPTFAVLFKLSKIPRICERYIPFAGYSEIHYIGWSPEVSLDIEFGYRCAGTCTSQYCNMREQGTLLHGVRYEILVGNHKEMVEKIFEICGLPASLISKAIEAFSYDSQGGTHINWENLAKAMPTGPKCTPAVLGALRRMSKELGVPDPDVWDDKEYVLPGTIKP